MVNYPKKYSSRLVEFSDSLHKHTKMNEPFLCGPGYTVAFEAIKRET